MSENKTTIGGKVREPQEFSKVVGLAEVEVIVPVEVITMTVRDK